MWGFPEMGVPRNEWFIGENPSDMDDLGVPPFMEPHTYIYMYVCIYNMYIYNMYIYIYVYIYIFFFFHRPFVSCRRGEQCEFPIHTSRPILRQSLGP